MNLERLEAVLDSMEQLVSGNDDRWAEVEAMLSAQRFVLEHICANAFLGRPPEELTRFMSGLVQATRSAATTSAPMDADLRVEQQARIATHLVRFADAVQLRVQQGPSRST